MAGQHRVVAAIDFGTYGTGFAWATVSRDNAELAHRRVIFFDQWEQQAIAAAKNRSAVLVDRSDGQCVAWGFRAVQLMDSAPRNSTLALQTGFKMALQRDQASAAAVGGTTGLTLAEGAINPYWLTVHILREVFYLARDQITRGPYVENDIRWCVTIPAIWDQYTRDLTYKAAVEAGLPDDPDRLLLVQEPAAAALYCAAKGVAVLSTPGTRFLVVDAGGGTLDITSYQVDPEGGLNELAAPSGAKAGSEYLNKAFMQKILVDRLGADFVSRMVTTQRSALAAMMDSWERAKRAFTVDSTDQVVIPLSAPLYAALIRDRTGRGASEEELDELDTEIVVSRREVADLFDTVVDETIALVGSRLAEMRELSGSSGQEIAVLVGGFAESPYLRARLGEYLETQDARLLVPEQPSVAVLAGAVHFAYDSSAFLTWRAPFTCGISVSLPFREGKDPESRRVIDAQAIEKCERRFGAFVRSRESVKNGARISKVYIPLRADQTTIQFDLLSCPRPDVEYADDPDVQAVGRLVVDIATCMHLPVAKREVKISMEFGQSRIVATAQNIHTGLFQTAEIEWQPTW